MMNLNHLETFHYFCKFLSMSRAADHLHISQPAVSQQLRAFQAECGVQLFYRDAQTYKLTDTGEAMFLLSKRIFARVDQIEGILEKARKTAGHTLRIGSTKAYASIVMPDLIARFREKYPQIRVRLSEGNSADLMSRLRSGKEDLVVVARTDYGAELLAVPFARAEFVLVARPEHPLAKKGTVSIKSLNGEPMIMREQGSGARDAILKRLSYYGVTPTLLMDSESLSFILAYLKRRNSVSFLLYHEIKDELARGALKQIHLVEGTIVFYSDIVLRRSEDIPVPMGYFLEILKKYGESNL